VACDFPAAVAHDTPWALSLAALVALVVISAYSSGGCVVSRWWHECAAALRSAAAHLSKWHYGQVIGLNDVTDLLPGITGLFGPNGAGKSTFLKLITVS
jgi:hypothetical protein